MANPNPDPRYQWKKGQSGNPGGKTSAHRKAEVRAAEAAALVQADLVEALARVLSEAGDEQKVNNIRSDVLKLLKDAQDRGFGAPVQHVDQTSSDGTMSPTKVEIVAVGKKPVDGE